MKTIHSAAWMSVLALASVLFLAPSSAQRAPAEAETKQPAAASLDVTEHVLENGLKVLVVHRPGVPLVSTYVWYKVGSADEERGTTGIAHFLEHMMFKGSRDYKKGEIDLVTVRNGGSNNAFTSNDYTAYYIDLPRSRYHEALRIEADRMRHLSLDLAEFDSEKKVVQSESDISADDPNDQLWERLDQTIYGYDHPYGHPVLGWPQDVEDTTRRDMRLFYEKHYWPNHATLVLAGDITGEEGVAAAKQYFGDLPKGPDLNRPQPKPVEFRGPKSFEVKSDSEVVTMAMAFPTVPAAAKDDAALDVLGVILGQGVASRLYRSLVDGSGVATDIGAGHYSAMLGGGFWIAAELAEGQDRDDLVSEIESAVRKLIEEGANQEELDRAKNQSLADAVFQKESASAIAGELGRWETIRGDWRLALSYPERVKRVTAGDVKRVAEAYLRRDNRVTGWLVPELTRADAESIMEDARPEALAVRRHVLDNGMVVLLLERPGLPVVSAQLSVQAGTATDPMEKPGLAAFAGSLLDTGTEKYSKAELAQAIECVGGELSAGSSGGAFRVLSQHTDIGLELLAQCLIHPTFPKAEIELLRKQTLAALEARKNETSSFAREAASAWVYGCDTPFGRPSLGTDESVADFEANDLHEWHNRWFRPDNAVLAVVGDFSEQEMLAKVENYFGAWGQHRNALLLPKFKFSQPVKPTGEQRFEFRDFDAAKVDRTKKRILINHPEKDQVVVRLQTLGIRRDNPDYYTLLVLDHVLGTSPGFTDRFSRTLRDEMGLAYSTYANITGGAGLYESAFLGYIGTRPENVESALEVMYQLLEQVREEPVPEEELRSVKDYLAGSFVFEVESTGQLASLLLSIERYKLGNDYLARYIENVEAVTAEDIQRAARKYLVPENMVEVMAGPVDRIGKPAEDGAEEDE